MSEIMNVPDGWESGFLTNFIDINPTVKIFKDTVYPFIEMDAVPFDGKKADYLTYRFGVEAGMKFKYKDTLLARITPSAENGKSLYVLDNIDVAIGSTEFIVFRGKNKKVDSEYVFYLVTSNLVRSKSIALMEGTSGRQRIPNTIYKDKIKVIIPTSLQEQQKIAKILSTLDKTIEATQRLIDKEKNIKKGLMHDLLTNGIDSNGKIRTPQTHTYKQSELGLIPEEWEGEKIGEICKFKQGIQIPIEEQFFDYEVDKYRFLRISDYTQQTDDKRYVSKIYKDYLITDKDVVMVRYGETAGFVGINLSGVLANNLFRIIPIKKIDNQFLYYYLNSLYNTFKDMREAGAMPAISFSSLSRVHFPFFDIEEQKQIAKILTTQDKKIQTEETNLAKLKELKKGLMNDLLSGKVRVNF